MSTITIKIDTDNLDEIAMHEIQAILRRSATAAENVRLGVLGSFPYEVVLGETLIGTGGAVAKFGFDKNKPKL